MHFRLNRKHWLRILLLLLVIAGIIIYRWYYYYYPYTRDAYVYANLTNISSVVKGHIVKMYVRDNQKVKAQQPLLQIDPQPFQYALARASSQLKAAQLAYEQAQANVKAAQDNVNEKTAILNKALDHLNRYSKLLSQRSISEITVVNAQAAVKTDKAAVNLAKQQLLIAQQRLNTTGIQKARANFHQAQYNLKHSIIRAPNDGYVTNVFAQVGDYIKIGQPLFALIDTQHWWVIARFRETVLRRIRLGETARIHIIMYPDYEFHGVIDSIGWGINRRQQSSSAAPSSLAYLQPTIDWIQIAQRFPVRIRITNVNPKFPLRIGATAHVKVNV